jgi:hypothetical protein
MKEKIVNIGIPLAVAAVMSLGSYWYSTELMVPSTLEAYPDLASIGFVDALFSNNLHFWLYYNQPELTATLLFIVVFVLGLFAFHE